MAVFCWRWMRFFSTSILSLKSIKGVCCILLMVSLTACQSLSSQQSFKQTREQQQVKLAHLLENLWLRVHVVPALEQGAPLVSSAKAGQAAIHQQNMRNIEIAKSALSELDLRVSERKQHPQTGDLALLNISEIRDHQQRRFQASPLSLYRAEQTEWAFMAQDGTKALLDVVWNEQGTLYMEGQEVLNLSSASSDIPRTVEVFYYAGKELAQASFTFSLQVEVPRLQ